VSSTMNVKLTLNKKSVKLSIHQLRVKEWKEQALSYTCSIIVVLCNLVIKGLIENRIK